MVGAPKAFLPACLPHSDGATRSVSDLGHRKSPVSTLGVAKARCQTLAIAIPYIKSAMPSVATVLLLPGSSCTSFEARGRRGKVKFDEYSGWNRSITHPLFTLLQALHTTHHTAALSQMAIARARAVAGRADDASAALQRLESSYTDSMHDVVQRASAEVDHCGGVGGRPLLYVYEQLGDEYRLVRGSDGGGGFGQIYHLSASSPLGAVPMRDTDQHAFPVIFHERALRYRCRTMDPSIADLFYIPIYNLIPNKPTRCHGQIQAKYDAGFFDALDAVRDSSNVSYLRRRHGVDHFLVTVGGLQVQHSQRELACAVYTDDARLAMTAILTQDISCMTSADHALEATWDDVASNTVFSIPYPSLFHLTSSSSADVLPWTRNATRTRKFLAAGVFAVSHSTSQHNERHKGQTSVLGRLRSQLGASCIRHAERCRFIALSSPSGKNNVSRERHFRSPGELARAVSAMYADATFCLQPMGDRFVRKGIIDSLIVGCIPVLFHASQLRQWPWHWGSWGARAVVMLNYSEFADGGDVVAKLASIDEAAVCSMRETIAANAHRIHYSESDLAEFSIQGHSGQEHMDAFAEDAFELTLSGMRNRVHELSAVELLPQPRLERNERFRKMLPEDCPRTY